MRIPRDISQLALPPRSPDPDPVENIWRFLHQNHLANRVHETCDAVVEVCCNAWNALVAQPRRISSTAFRHWAQVIA